MGLSNPRSFFGLHSVSPYSRTDGTFYGVLKVLKGSNFTSAATNVELTGGSQKYPWKIETGMIKSEIDLKVAEYPDFLFTLFLGATPSDAGVSATGSASTPLNIQGTSCIKATTGIAGLQVTPSTGAANLKFGRYLIKVASATTVNIYAATDLDSARGSPLPYTDDTLLVAAALTVVTTGAATSIPNLGVDLLGGSGTIAMIVGDTASFEVLPPSNKSMSVKIGAANSVYPEFGLICMGQRTGDKTMIELEVFRAKGAGMPMPFAPNAFNEADIKLGVFYDSVKDGVANINYIEET